MILFTIKAHVEKGNSLANGRSETAMRVDLEP